MIVELKEVVAGYGETTVLRGVDMKVEEGSVVALLGPNGAGKTTLLRVVSGLLRPSSGTVAADGRSLRRLAPHRRARLGICLIPEGRGIFPALTVKDNITVLAGRSNPSEALEAAVEAFPVIGTRMSQIAGTLSGGEQQMLALSRAYASNAKCVLLDEVSMGLAPKIVDEIFSFLGVLRQRGVSLVLVEQYVVRALEVCDRVYLLQRGRITFAGEPSELDPAEVLRTYVGVDAEGEETA